MHQVLVTHQLPGKKVQQEECLKLEIPSLDTHRELCWSFTVRVRKLVAVVYSWIECTFSEFFACLLLDHRIRTEEEKV